MLSVLVSKENHPFLLVYLFTICILGVGPRHNMQAVLPRGTTWRSPLTVYTTQYHTQRAVIARHD